MTTIVLALAAAAMYGLSDFIGGVLAKRTSVWAVAVVTQLAATVIVGGAAAVLPGRAAGADWFWGAVAGLGTGAGTAFLYRGLASGRMGVVAPLSAVGAAVLPVIVGLVTGERPEPLTWIGIACAFPAIWLVSTAAGESVTQGGTPRRLGDGVGDGLLAGLGFGVLFVALGQVPDEAGLWPLALAEVVSVVAVILLAVAFGQAWVPRELPAAYAVLVGALAAGANILFLFATQAGLLAVASVLTSLYPAFTVILAATLLRERIHGAQAVGLVLAGVAVGLVAAG